MASTQMTPVRAFVSDGRDAAWYVGLLDNNGGFHHRAFVRNQLTVRVAYAYQTDRHPNAATYTHTERLEDQ